MWNSIEPQFAAQNEQALTNIAMPSWIYDEYNEYLQGQSRMRVLQQQLQTTKIVSEEMTRTLDELMLKIKSLDPITQVVDRRTAHLSRVKDNIEKTIDHVSQVGEYYRIAMESENEINERSIEGNYSEYLNWTNAIRLALQFWSAHPTYKHSDKHQRRLKDVLRRALNTCESELERILQELSRGIDITRVGWPIPADYTIIPDSTIDKLSSIIQTLNTCERITYLNIIKTQRMKAFTNTITNCLTPAVYSYLVRQRNGTTSANITSAASQNLYNSSINNDDTQYIDSMYDEGAASQPLTRAQIEEQSWQIEDEASHALVLDAAVNAKLTKVALASSKDKDRKKKMLSIQGPSLVDMSLGTGSGINSSLYNTMVNDKSNNKKNKNISSTQNKLISASTFLSTSTSSSINTVSLDSRYFKQTHHSITAIDIFIQLAINERQCWEYILTSTVVSNDDMDDAFSFVISSGLRILLQFIKNALKPSQLQKSDALLQTLDIFEHLSRRTHRIRSILPRAISTNDTMGEVMEVVRTLSESIKTQISQYLTELISISSYTANYSSHSSKLNEFVLPFCVDVLSFLKRLAEYSAALNSLDSSTVSELYATSMDKTRTVKAGFIVKFLTKYGNNEMEIISICTEIVPSQYKMISEARQRTRSELMETLVNPSTTTSSPTQVYQTICWCVGSALEAAIDVQGSLRASNPTICTLFLLNNLQYILRSATTTSFPIDLGRLWEVRYSTLLKHLRGAYLTVTWEKTLQLLSFDENKMIISQYVKNGVANSTGKKLIKKKFEGFNLCFDKIISTQQSFFVPDTDLRSTLRVANIDLIIPLYKSFLAQFEDVHFTRKSGKYKRYPAHYVETKLNHLFDDVRAE